MSHNRLFKKVEAKQESDAEALGWMAITSLRANRTLKPNRWLYQSDIDRTINHIIEDAEGRVNGSFIASFQADQLVFFAQPQWQWLREGKRRPQRPRHHFQSEDAYEEYNKKKARRSPHYFVVHTSNHFVVVGVDKQGMATIYNEHAGAYDAEVKAALITGGFSADNITISPIAKNQIDSWSCGDRAIKIIVTQLGIEHPIVDASPTDSAAIRAATTVAMRKIAKKKGYEPNPPPPVCPALNDNNATSSIHSSKVNIPSMLGDANINAITVLLQRDGWVVTTEKTQNGQAITSLAATKGAESFKITSHAMTTNSSNLATFTTMLKAYQAVHGDREPNITTKNQAYVETWKQAYQAVYNKAAPAAAITFEDPAPKIETNRPVALRSD